MTETLHVFVYIVGSPGRIVTGAIEEINKIYAHDGAINLAVVDATINSRVSTPDELISRCSVAIFVISPEAFRDPSLYDITEFRGALGHPSLADIKLTWDIARRSFDDGKLKHLAVFAPKEASGKFILQRNSQRDRLMRRLRGFLSQIGDNHLLHTYTSDTELASSLVGTFIRWQLGSHDLETLPEAVPEQSRLGLMFGSEDEAPLGLIDLPDDSLLSTPHQQQIFTDIRERAELLLAECADSNRLAVLRSYATTLLGAMGGTVAELKVLSFWAPMNSLRRRSEADERIRRSLDPDDLPLPENVAGLLLDLVDNINLFRAYQPSLAALDEIAQDQMTRLTTSENLAAAQRVSDTAASNRMAVTREAAASLQETASEATGDGLSAERAKQFSIRSARNLSLEAVRRVYQALKAEPSFAVKEIRAGVYRQLGQSLATHLGLFLLQCEADIQLLFSTLGMNPTLQGIFRVIISVFKSAGRT